jgi:hypothetical protein
MHQRAHTTWHSVSLIELREIYVSDISSLAYLLCDFGFVSAYPHTSTNLILIVAASQDEVQRVDTVKHHSAINSNIAHRLYFVQNPTTSLETALNTVNTLVQSTETNYHTATRQGTWSLQYRLFRDVIAPSNAPSTDAEGKPKPFAHTLQHHLHLSSLDQNRTYTCIQPPTGTSIVSAIPSRQQQSYALLLRHQFAALWQPRHILTLLQGTTLNAGLCTVQLGELRWTREGPQSAGVQSPGVLICISTTIGADASGDPLESGTATLEEGDDQPDFAYAQAVIRDCWSKIKNNLNLGKSEIREVMMAQDIMTATQEKEAAVRMWCEVLRVRV